MARTAVAIKKLAGDAGNTPATAVTIDATNHHVVDVAGKSNRLVLFVTNSHASTKTVTIKASDMFNALQASMGDLEVSIATSSTAVIGPLTSARFLQSDGTIHVNVAASMTGTISAYLVPDNI